MIEKIINTGLRKFGFQIKRVSSEANLELTMFDALKRCIDRGLDIKTVIDIGASDGSWSRECLKLLPSAHYLLVEAQEQHRESLDKFIREKKNVEYILAAAGNREGMIYFDNGDLFGGLASDEPFDSNCIEVPVIKIDNAVLKQKLEGPYLLKLDTHGFEVPILEGAAETLKNAGLVIIETYNYQLTKDSLKFYQMCEYMRERGFATIEMVDLLLRKYDNSFWQMDTFFIPGDRKEFGYTEYS